LLYDVNKNIEMVYFERWKLHDKKHGHLF